jgi:hypothetical protein
VLNQELAPFLADTDTSAWLLNNAATASLGFGSNTFNPRSA